VSEGRKLSTADIARGPGDGSTADDGQPEQLPAVTPLLSNEDAGRYREQWTSVQGEFVDEPRAAVQQADALVADLMQRLAEQFSRTREGLESRWEGDSEVSTEDLRLALQQYRSFFERLLEA